MKKTQIYLVITRACNYACPFCIRKNLEERKTFANAELIYSVLEKSKKILPNAMLIISGGEPTLHPDIKKIVDFATKNFERVAMVSNGSFDSDFSVFIRPYLKSNLFLQMSLDGTLKIHNSIRGKNAFEKVVENLKLLEDVSSRISLSTTVSLLNYNNIPLLVNVLNDLKFACWKVSMAQEDPTKPMLSCEKWNNLVDKILLTARFQVHIKKMFDFSLFDKVIKNGRHFSEISNCGLGENKFYITPDFDVELCSCFSNPIGNILKDDVSKIQKNLLHYSQISVDPKSPCFKCEYQTICNGGCPGYSKKVFNQLNFGDIRCPRVKKYVDEKR